MSTVYFDLSCGASGDMILSSLIDAGVPSEYLKTELAKLPIEGLELIVETTKRSGIGCTHIDITAAEQKAYRHLPQILEIIEQGGYKKSILDRARTVLNRIGEAEAKVHGIALEKVHFHEIGAVDTIVDVLCACLGLDYLGAEKVAFSKLTVGHGTVECDHGLMPVPAPATAEMLTGFAATTLDIGTEILTPTGCAILTGLGTQVSAGPSGKVSSIGYGCGNKVFESYPNVLRVLVVEEEQESGTDAVCVLESDMDHISGEVLGFTAEQLMAMGALDVSWSPVFMKKGRPGYRLTVLCELGKQESFADCIIANTRSLGVRYHQADRIVAKRTSAKAAWEGESIEVKTCEYKGNSFAKPEYESLAKVARDRKVPLIDLIERFSAE